MELGNSDDGSDSFVDRWFIVQSVDTDRPQFKLSLFKGSQMHRWCCKNDKMLKTSFQGRQL